MINVVSARYEPQLGGDVSGMVYIFTDGTAAAITDNGAFYAETEDELWDENFEDKIPGRYLDAIRRYSKN